MRWAVWLGPGRHVLQDGSATVKRKCKGNPASQQQKRANTHAHTQASTQTMDNPVDLRGPDILTSIPQAMALSLKHDTQTQTQTQTHKHTDTDTQTQDLDPKLAAMLLLGRAGNTML